jgi:hypothetical protein
MGKILIYSCLVLKRSPLNLTSVVIRPIYFNLTLLQHAAGRALKEREPRFGNLALFSH